MAELSLENISLEFDGGLAVLTLNDPDRVNAISSAMAEGIMRALQECAKPRRGVRALLLTGAGRGFCAGANLAGRGSEGMANLPVLSRADALYHPLVRKLREFDRPVVSAVNGACIGIGLAMVLQSDYVIASETAYFQAPFVKLGSGIDGGLTWGLPRVIGPMRSRQMLMRAERISGETMRDWGLVAQTLPSEGFAEAARAIAAEFAAGPTIALSETRRLLLDSFHSAFDGHLEAESRALARTFRSKDNQAGIKAFATKTEARFTGE